MMTELHEVAGHRVEPDAVQFDLRRLFNRTKVNLVTDVVQHVDQEGKRVITSSGEFPYDYLILGMGGEPNDFGTPGVKEYAFTLWSWEDAVRLREHIEQTVRAASMELDEDKRRAMLTFIVCGSGFTGIEMAGELLEWRERLALDHKLRPEDITLYVVEAAPTILNMLDRKDADKAEAYMVKHGIKILKNSPIVEVKESSIVLKSGEEIPAYTLIWTAGVKANSDVEPFGFTSGRAGRLIVNEYMESIDAEDVYVVGDLAYYEEEPNKPVPQIVEAAEQTAATAAKNIIAAISGGRKTAYKGNYHGFMVSIGARYGVANLNGIRLSGFFAIFMKHLVNLYYLFTIRSGYYMWQYIRHEFFETRDRRSIFRNLLNRYGNVLWSVPLRIYVGAFWISEAGAKLWGRSTWEAGTEISQRPAALPRAGPGFLARRLHCPHAFRMAAYGDQRSDARRRRRRTKVTPILSKMPGIFEGLMRIMLPNPGMAVFMQKVVVFAELAIGLALIFGLFTWLASLASAGFLLMFTLSAMLGWNLFWALPASIALMNGSGTHLWA